MKENSRWIEELKNLVGEHKVLTEKEMLEKYSEDYTEEEAGFPDAVVIADEFTDVLKTVKFSGGRKIPLTPVVANTNVGGLAIPKKGGIVLDMKGMKRIVDFNRNEMYVIVEPGVTFGILKDFLEKNAPDLTIAYPLAPPDVSVLANCILDGLGNLSFLHGSMSEWIGGMEVVLSDGSVIKTGACALSDYWFSRGPLPDLSGLFVNWQGTTGIVTKISVQLWKNPPFRKRTFTFSYSVEDGFLLLKTIARKFIYSDLGGLTWPPAKMLFSVKQPLWRDKSEPEFFIYADLTGYSKEDLKVKVKMFQEDLNKIKKAGAELEGPVDIDSILSIAEEFKKFADFPMTLDFLLEKGGLSWIGTYGPTSKWEEAVRKGEKLMLEYGFPPIVVTRPMKGGHFGVLRFITTFEKKDEQVKRKVRELNEKLAEMAISLGYVPYKMPSYLWKKFTEKFNPGYIQLLEKIKKLLDPYGILNPGKLIF